MSDKCPFCGAPEAIPKLNIVPTYKCGSINVGEKILRSWSCREIIQLQARIEELEAGEAHMVNNIAKCILSKETP